MNELLKTLIRPLYYSFKFWCNDYPYRKVQRKNKCIFIHIPKTAGTSVLSSLNKGINVSRDHVTWQEYKNRSPHFFKNHFKFSFVRNPWDRAVSVYFYLRNGGNQQEDLYYKQIIENNFQTFEKFAEGFLNKDTIWSHRLFWPQSFYLIDHQGKLQVDFLGKFESINDDFQYIMKILKIYHTLPQTNKSPRKEYEKYYTDKTIQKIKNLYSLDIEIFDYHY